MSKELSKEVIDAIARWVKGGYMPPRLGQQTARPVMQEIACKPKLQPIPDLPKLPAERKTDRCHKN